MDTQIRFHECSIPSVTYLRGDKIENSPVNMGRVTTIRKTRTCWYPDNDGKPAIRFEGADVAWTFDTEAQRDAEFAGILAKFA